MRLKSFTAKTLTQAMELVRQQFGPDAVILSTQSDEAAGTVSVTAALEESPLDELEVGEIIEGYKAVDQLSEVLGFHRVPTALADRLLGAAAGVGSEDGTMALAGALDAELNFKPLPGASVRAPVMLVGLPGAGKSATAAKLCARARLADRQASLITMDTIKAGGLAQAAAFAKALGTRLEQAPDADSLAAAVANCEPDQLVVIDTVGANPFDDDERDQLALAAGAAGAEIALVLQGGGDAVESAEVALAFAAAGATGLIATKLDLARRLGGVLSAAHVARLSLIATGISPNIGGGLALVNPVSLARLILAGTTPTKSSTLVRESS